MPNGMPVSILLCGDLSTPPLLEHVRLCSCSELIKCGNRVDIADGGVVIKVSQTRERPPSAIDTIYLSGSPTTRLAAVAFGAGVGLGSAYTDCSRIFDGSLPKWPLPANVSSPLSSSSPEDTAH